MRGNGQSLQSGAGGNRVGWRQFTTPDPITPATGKQPSHKPPMLHRIIYEDWQLIFPLIAIVVASLICLAAWRTTDRKSDNLARLPADNE